MSNSKKTAPLRRPRKPVDLADIKADAIGKPGTADLEIAAAVAASKRDRVGQIARGGMPDTATAALKRAMADADPLGAAIEHAGLFRGGAGELAVRDALLGGGLAGRASATGNTNSIIDQALISTRKGSLAETATGYARGSVGERTAREMVEAQRKMSDLILGRSTADRELASMVSAAQGRIGQLDGVSQLATRRAAIGALEDAYAALGMGKDRERLLGHVTGVGSLARIASGLIDHAGDMRRRTSEMLAETERLLAGGAQIGAIDGALRTGYRDLFPAMRRPRATEIEAVITATTALEALKPYPDWAAQARQRFDAISTPWVRSDLPDASIAAMARLVTLDKVVDHGRPGDSGVIEALRGRLGDYRGDDASSGDALDDPVARTGYQLDRGFDPVLTVLPTAVVAVMFAPFGASDPAVEVDPDQLENAVRMLIKRLEHALRRFIADRLQSLYGDTWFDALPSEIRRAWTAGRQRDIEAGRTPDDLIAYADFEHYRRIIEHPDRWPRLFEPVFRDQAAIRETLRRIAVIRNPGAHFRAVTLEDLIILRAEGVHLSKWLGLRLGD
jgi:hypothetical protein